MRRLNPKKYPTKTNKRNTFRICGGDTISFERETYAYPADENTWDYSNCVQRAIYADELLIYEKCVRKGGKFFHHFKCLGLNYVYCGLIELLEN